MRARLLLREPTSTSTSMLAATLVGQSADGDSNEMVTFVNPPAGTYTVYVHGFNTAGPSANFTLFEWQLSAANAGNMTVPGPAATTTGGSVPVNLSFTGLTPSTWYLGQVHLQRRRHRYRDDDRQREVERI